MAHAIAFWLKLRVICLYEWQEHLVVNRQEELYCKLTARKMLLAPSGVDLDFIYLKTVSQAWSAVIMFLFCFFLNLIILVMVKMLQVYW